MISVDAKKKENVGNFRNGGAEWAPAGQPERVSVRLRRRGAGQGGALRDLRPDRERRLGQRRHRSRHRRVRCRIDSPHCLRHPAITFALDAGTTPRDVQGYTGRKDPRTTRRYDHARDSLDRNAADAVAAYPA